MPAPATLTSLPGLGDHRLVQSTPRKRSWPRRFRLRRSAWSGAGTIVEKRFYDGGTPGPSLEFNSPWNGFVMADSSPTRWILAVEDDSAKVHCVFVARLVWQRHHVGDVITATDPLVDVR